MEVDMSKVGAGDLSPMPDDQLAEIKRQVESRWHDKPHYQHPDSPKCMMTCHEVLTMIKRIEVAESNPR